MTLKSKDNLEASVNTPVSEKKYSGQYPDMIEFEKPWESTIQVGQGRSYISTNGKPLQSEGFSKCPALVVKNRLTYETALFHIDDIDLSPQQEKTLAQISAEGGLVATFIRGTGSRDLKSRVFDADLKPLGVSTTDDIVVETGRQHWGIVVKPEQREIYVDARSKKKVITFRY